MASDADYRAWAKLLKSKNTEKLLEGISHASDDLAFITNGGGPYNKKHLFPPFFSRAHPSFDAHVLYFIAAAPARIGTLDEPA